ncbi:MAG: type II toxin-antitoxin system HicA family toxin [Clostridia bacterium]|nr:type II toxin-antitoxin system HicA family toxin [Clostridia bacterium]
MKIYSSRELLAILIKRGWYVKRQRGSHVQLVHDAIIGKVTIPHPKKNISYGTAMSILHQAGIDIKEETDG